MTAATERQVRGGSLHDCPPLQPIDSPSTHRVGGLFWFWRAWSLSTWLRRCRSAWAPIEDDPLRW